MAVSLSVGLVLGSKNDQLYLQMVHKMIQMCINRDTDKTNGQIINSRYMWVKTSLVSFLHLKLYEKVKLYHAFTSVCAYVCVSTPKSCQVSTHTDVFRQRSLRDKKQPKWWHKVQSGTSRSALLKYQKMCMQQNINFHTFGGLRLGQLMTYKDVIRLQNWQQMLMHLEM